MRKYLLSLTLILFCIGAGAQKSGSWEFNPVNHINVFYNHALGAPEGLSPSGWGFDFPLLGAEYSSADEKNLFTVDLVNISIDFGYVKKGFTVLNNGDVAQLDAGKCRVFTYGLTLPLGYIHKFNYHWGMGLSVEPGVDFASYQLSYETDFARHTDTFRPKKNAFGFRLDVKLAFWYNDIGLMVRYRPFSCQNQGMHHQTGLLSAGITIRY